MTTQRYSIYRPIHKAMRHILFSTSQQVGLTDFGDDADVTEALEAVDRMISLLHEHRENEDRFVHPPAERKIPGITAKFEEDHVQDIALSNEVQGITSEIRKAGGADRMALGIKLHERLNDYIGIYLGHLYREETTMQQALWENFTDEELIAIEMEIVANVPPPVMADLLKVFCSTYSADEIAPILGNIKANAPPEFAQFALQTAEQNLPPRSWEKVKTRLG
ncbi:MAG: hemerythrin domain-containing protein [Chloroflexi bacterium]|nr:hemerythrin domain-containing protein [Chloroflexota bacterium]